MGDISSKEVAVRQIAGPRVSVLALFHKMRDPALAAERGIAKIRGKAVVKIDRAKCDFDAFIRVVFGFQDVSHRQLAMVAQQKVGKFIAVGSQNPV